MKPESKLMEVTVSRTIPAKAEEVFDVWLDAKSPGSPWFGSERVILNPTVDGLYYFAVKNEGRVWPHYGRFLKIERPRRLELSWMSESTRGLESLVTVTLETRGGTTEITVRHAGLPDEEMGRQHEQGWGWILSTLAERFAPRPSASPTR